MNRSNAPKDGHRNYVPKGVLEVILAKGTRSDKAKRIIRKCLHEGYPYNHVAMENGVTRQYVHEICRKTYTIYLEEHL